MDERRRFFRIDDTIGLRYEVLTEAEARRTQQDLERGEFDDANQLQMVERQLQLLIDKMRVQNPEFADAASLLNAKFNLLKGQIPSYRDDGRVICEVSISACGICVDIDERMREGETLLLDLTLLPTDLHIHTLATVISCEKADEPGQWTLSADFTNMLEQSEEMLVQHIVKRQGRLLAAERQS